MFVSIGSRSLPKVAAVCRGFSRYPELWVGKNDTIKYIILPKEMRGEATGTKQIDSTSKVSCNPMTLDETIMGAKNRAKEAFEYCIFTEKACSFGVGIEAGLFPVNFLDTGYFDTSICAIYDGEHYYIGGSPLFEYPKKVVSRMLAGEEAGLIIDFFGDTAKGRPGVIGPLTNGRVMRDDFEENAVLMALSKIVAKDLYMKG